MLISPPRGPPPVNMSTSIQVVPDEDVDLLSYTEATDTITAPGDYSELVTEVKDYPAAYIAQASCATPILPSNTKITLPANLLKAVESFKDSSNDRRARASSQRLVERYLVEQGTCSKLNPGILQDFRLRIFNVDSDTLDSTLATQESLNANLHDDISCAVDAIMYDGKLPGVYTPSQRERVRNWFPSITQIGQESVEGYALKTSFTPDTNLFVMKAPRNPNNDELVHEALIGFYALNKLRRVLPNYMYVYGYVKCSPPALQDKQALTWCSSSNPAVSYLLAENIRDAEPIGDFITNPNTSALNFLVTFYQVLNALNVAYKYYGYTHYDLHTGNIMVRKFSKIIAVPYFGATTEVAGYLASAYIPYIIDYGYSRITVGGIGFGKVGLEFAGIHGEHAFPMFDVYKLLGFLGQSLYTKPQTPHYADIAAILEKLFSFFGVGTLLDRVKQRLSSKQDWYNLSDNYRSITHDDYINWLQSGSGLAVPVHPNLLHLMAQGIYAAPINTKMDTCAFYNMVASEDGPATSLEYCEVVAAISADSTLTPQAKQDALTWLNGRFDASQNFVDTIGNIQAKVQTVNDILRVRRVGSGNIIPEISSLSNLTASIFVDTYRAHILDLLRIKDIAALVISYIKSHLCALITQSKLNSHKAELDRFSILANQWLQIINTQREILKKNAVYAKSINWTARSSDSKIVKFWTTEHANLILAV